MLKATRKITEITELLYYWKPKVVIIYFVGVSGTTGYHNDNLRGRNWR